MEEGALLFEYRADNGRDALIRTAVVFQDHIQREPSSSPRPWTKLALAFLPEGYPNSVTSDYLAFQTWDTLQGISTYIRSMLSTQALLSGIGVGAATATAIGATFQWFLRDLTGMIGGIVFTLYQGSNLDNRAKQWRLAADFMNDIGMLMDLVSPLFPRAFMLLLCLGSAARAVTGVASGATRAALTQHFARKQNAADVSAKEGSQETAATLVGMILGMALARLTATSIEAMWGCFLILTVFHMFANYKAVCSLCLTSLNAERIGITLRSFLHHQHRKVCSPDEASAEESVLPQLFGSRVSSKLVFGAKISSLCLDERRKTTSSISRYGTGKYLLICTKDSSVHVVLHRKAMSSLDFLRAYTHAVLLQTFLETSNGKGCTDAAEEMSMGWMEEFFPVFLLALQESGWNADHVLISVSEWRADWNVDKKLA